MLPMTLIRKHGKSWIPLVICIVFLVIHPALAATLDASFDEDGKVLTDMSGGTSFIDTAAMVEQGDGKIVAVGYTGSHMALMRFNTNGTLDTTFGGDGKVVLTLADADFATRAVIDANGKIVVVGYNAASYFLAYLLVARVNSDGTLDTTFSGDGWMKIDMGGASDVRPSSVAIDQNNRILVTGNTNPNSYQPGPFVMRLRPNGGLDTTFDGDGRLVPPLNPCTDVAIDGQGRILLAGSGQGLALARLNYNGSLDTSFAGTGLVYDTSTYVTPNSQVAVLDNGNIAVTGKRTWPSEMFVQIRYTESGNRRHTFGNDGYSEVTLGEFANNHDSYRSSIAPNGTVTIAAVAYDTTADPPQNAHIRLARFAPNGTLDSNFGGDGKVDLPPSVGLYLTAFLVQRDGRAIVNSGLSFARLNSGGALDAQWSGGIVKGAAALLDSISALAIDNGGKIVVAGGSTAYPDYYTGMARYLPDGKLDTSFGNGGKVLSSSLNYFPAVKLLIDGAGRILTVGGVRDDGLDRLVMARFNSNGSPDTSFGQGGRIVYSKLGSYPYALYPNGAALLPDGKIVVGMRGVIARFNSNGSADTSFGDNSFLPGFRRLTELDKANKMVPDNEGRFVFTVSESGNFGVVRLNANGTVDSTFGKDGKAIIDLGKTEEPWSLAVAPDGKILVGGYSEPPFNGIRANFYNASAALVRLNANGSLDTSFNNGKLLVPTTQGRAFGALVVDKFGRIWANVYAKDDFKMARVRSDGRLDTTFGVGGFFSVNFGGIDHANPIALDKAGRMVMGGVSDANGDDDFALARIVDTPEMTVSGSSALEGNSGTVTVPFTITLSAPSLATITVRYATANGTATSGSDYVAKGGTLTFLPGQIEKQLMLVVNGDTLPEGDETVLLNLSSPVNVTLRESQATSSIINDDNAQ